MNPPCNICNAATVGHAQAVYRKRHGACLLRCSNCGFLFVEKPYWLAEAYAEPINSSDTGYVWRNLWARDIIRECIESHLNPAGTFLDYAAGYGLFVRLMRDAGYDFRWADLYCQNLFARGFEASNPLTGPFEAVTAFEVFEHLTNPAEELEKLLAITSCLIFGTKLVPEPAPQIKEWWYYGLEHGQHIAFYTRKSLELLAGRFDCQLVTDGADLHVLSKKSIPPEFFCQSKISRWRFWARPVSRLTRVSLTSSDHDFIAKKMLQNYES